MSRCTKTSTVYSLKPYTQSTTLHSTPGRLCARSTVYERTNDITYMVGRGPLGSRHSRLGTRSLCKVCLYFTLFHISAHILLFSPPAGRGPRVTRTPHMYPTTPDGVHGSTRARTPLRTLARPSNVGKSCVHSHMFRRPRSTSTPWACRSVKRSASQLHLRGRLLLLLRRRLLGRPGRGCRQHLPRRLGAEDQRQH